MADSLVVDASPAILLGRVGRLDLLPSLAKNIVVPAAVLAEIRAGADRDKTVADIESTPWARVVGDEGVPQHIAAWDLGRGESQVLAYAVAHGECEVVLVDAAARRCAAALGLAAVGTLGPVLRAKARGVVPQLVPSLRHFEPRGSTLPTARWHARWR